MSKPLVHVVPNYNFQRIEGYNFIATNKSIDELWGANYIMFQNADYGDKWFYAFITKLEYKQRNNTWIHFEIDVLQTWIWNVTFKPSYVVREHCPLYNSDGTPVINTQDEGLAYGREYNTVSVSQLKPYGDLYFLVVVAKKAMHDTSGSTHFDADGYGWSMNGLPQPLNYYIHPFYLDGSVPASNFTLNEQVGAVMVAMYEWVQTNNSTASGAVDNIVSMYVTNYLPDQSPYDGTTITFNTNYYQNVTIGSLQTVFVNSMVYSTGIQDLGNKYNGFTSVVESKLLMYPYTVTVLTDFKGNQVELKNEYINNTNLMIDIKGSLGTSNKVSYSVKDYNTTITDDTFKDAISQNHAIIDNSPNDIPVLVDMLSAFIQGNKNSLQNQYHSIMFNGVANLAGSSIGAIASMASGSATGIASSITGGIQGAGNSVLQMQAMNAKQEDIKNTPPSIYNMGGNPNFDFGNGYTGLWVLKKEITSEYRKKLSDFFNMFGYKVNEVKLPNTHTRANWNYVQTKGIVLIGSINNQDLQELKDVFDNGITLWHTDDIGNYALDNGVL
jgi:hypothetical protein